MNNQDAGAPSANRREQIAALLSRYPELSAQDLNEIHDWFKRSASALDLGTLASDPGIAHHYRAYRAQHYDRITMADAIRAVTILLLVVAFVGAIVVIAL